MHRKSHVYQNKMYSSTGPRLGSLTALTWVLFPPVSNYQWPLCVSTAPSLCLWQFHAPHASFFCSCALCSLSHFVSAKIKAQFLFYCLPLCPVFGSSPYPWRCILRCWFASSHAACLAQLVHPPTNDISVTHKHTYEIHIQCQLFNANVGKSPRSQLQPAATFLTKIIVN